MPPTGRILLLPFLLIAGLFLPGFFLAKSLGQRLREPTAFVLSLLVLFHSIFWLAMAGVRISVFTVLFCLLVATIVAVWLASRSPAAIGPAKRHTRPTRLDRTLVVSSSLVGLTLLVRSFISPLIGYDTQFRWDFLAQKLLMLGKFDFYPPQTSADFATYFSVDGIPPLVSFVHWWLYASAGQYWPWLICIFVGTQFLCTLLFTYGAASALISRRAGFMAAAILAACPLFFRAVVLGQETGLTALSIAAMIYFVATAKPAGDLRSVILAGLAASLCALSREYGWIAVPAGLIALAWKRHHLKQVLVFSCVATAAALPWYARNWMLTGNPFYPLRLGPLAVNPIYDGILQHYDKLLGIQIWTLNDWTNLAWFLLLWAPLQLLAGVSGGIVRFRQYAYLTAITLLLSAVWLQSVGYTSGGAAISTRVLSPAMVVLSILAAALLQPWSVRPRAYQIIVAFIVVCQLLTAAHGAVYPNDPLSLPPSQWLQNAFRPVAPPAEFQVRDQLHRILPAGSRILTDNAYLHAALTDQGVDVVPVWSPEVRFLYSGSAEDSERQLRALKISGVAYYPESLNTSYLISASPFYASLPQRWRVLVQAPGFLTLYVPQPD